MEESSICDINSSLEQELSNKPFIHICGFHLKEFKNDQEKGAENFRNSFKGILIDTGANCSSIISICQYRSYREVHGTPASIEKSKESNIRSPGGKSRTIGTSTLSIPFNELRVIFYVKVHMMNDTTLPTLFCLKDVKCTGIDLSIQEECLILIGKKHKLVYGNHFLLRRWEPDQALNTIKEVEKLQCDIGYQSVSALYNLLKNARQN